MARIEYHGVWNHAKQHRLVSDKPAYAFQILYLIPRCKGHYETKEANGVHKVHLCTEEHLQWRGEFSDGTFTQFFDIEPHHFAAWKRRTETDPARPEAQLMSEYSKSVSKPSDQVLSYLEKVDEALKWWQGKRIKA